MPDIEVRLMLPIDNRMITAELDDSMTPDEIVAELIASNTIQPSDSGYRLAIKGGAQLNATTALKDANLGPNDVVLVIPATDAG